MSGGGERDGEVRSDHELWYTRTIDGPLFCKWGSAAAGCVTARLPQHRSASIHSALDVRRVAPGQRWVSRPIHLFGELNAVCSIRLGTGTQLRAAGARPEVLRSMGHDPFVDCYVGIAIAKFRSWRLSRWGCISRRRPRRSRARSLLSHPHPWGRLSLGPWLIS